MRRLALALILLTAACAGGPARETVRGVPASSLGLAPGDVASNPAPGPVPRNETAPGETPAPPRPYPGAPPVIPHAVADFLPITRGENLCLECHMVEERIEGEATPIPPSHYTDLRNAPGEAGETVTGARWNCTACHAPQTGASPLVENEFTARSTADPKHNP